MFCTFIFAVLLLKILFFTGDQLQRYCASDISYSNQATYNGGRKCDWQHSMAHPWKSPYRRKNLADISYTDRVLSQILFHGNGCRSEKCSLQHSMAHPRNPPPYRRKNLSDIFYTSRVIANFVPNFIGMATGVGQGKRQLAAFDGPSPETPP